MQPTWAGHHCRQVAGVSVAGLRAERGPQWGAEEACTVSLGGAACHVSGALQGLGHRSRPGRQGRGVVVLIDRVGVACHQEVLEMAPLLHLGAQKQLAWAMEGVWPHVPDSHHGSS